MSFTSWLRGLKALAQHTFRKQGGTRSNRPRRLTSSNLLVERLEDRLTPASLVPLASFFDGNNGSGPNGSLVEYNGNLFGTANSGGAYGRGTVFKVAPDGTITDLADFNGSGNGAYPNGGLVQDNSGDLFGTTQGDGASVYGTVFEVKPDSSSSTGYTLTTLATFGGSTGSVPNGSYPNGNAQLAGVAYDGLVLDGGYLYGTTLDGGTSALGSVFKVKTDGSGFITTLASFDGLSDGSNPVGGLVGDSKGDLFGATSGRVFELAAGSSSITPLASISALNADLFVDSHGDVFGTTAGFGTFGGGTVFELKPDGSTSTGFGTPVTLATFAGYYSFNTSGALVEDSTTGNLYGITNDGGYSNYGSAVFKLAANGATSTGFDDTISLIASTGRGGGLNGGLLLNGDTFFGTMPGGTAGLGTVFNVPLGGGTISTLASFSYDSGNNGAYPTPFLLPANDGSGDYFGTTTSGGSSQNGVVYKVTPGGTITDLASFDSSNSNAGIGQTLFNPGAGLIEDTAGNLFGTTYIGGGAGTVFELKSGSITPLVNFGDFNGLNGIWPAAGLLPANDGSDSFFGTTSFGGPDEDLRESGTLFEMTPDGAIKTLVYFSDGGKGAHPVGGLVADYDSSRNLVGLFGTTILGGKFGHGTVFEVIPPSSGSPDYTLKDLADFNGSGTDSPGSGAGANPVAGLFLDPDSGYLFGTTGRGGTSGNGTVFEVQPNVNSSTGYTLTTLASFDGSNGSNPVGALVEDPNTGDLFGTTEEGGTFEDGTVFELAQGSITTLVSFDGGDGAFPDATLVLDGNGNLVGTTSGGGTWNNGTVFKVILDVFSHDELQAALSGKPSVDPVTGNPTLAFQANTQAQAKEFMDLFDPTTPGFTALTRPTGGTTDIVVTLGASISFKDANVSVPDGIHVLLNGGIWNGGSPALTLSSGDLTITGATFVNATDAPTILVTGGSLTLRNDVIQESTGYTDAAITITSGTLDLGTSSDAGGNTININGTGTFINNTTANHITAVGDTFEINGQVTAWPITLNVTTNSSLMLVGKTPPPLTGSVNGTSFTSPFQYTTGFGDTVTITLSTTATSASPVGQYPITATLSGTSADNCFIVPSYGMVYVVSVGADPTDPTHVESVSFWDNKGNARVITAADLSSLDALNLVTQSGSDFDPKSVAQLQAWLSISPNATAAYQLAEQLAAMDLNVMAGYVQASDLVFAGGLLSYATADHITGLTSGEFINVQNLMQAANAVLATVTPGTPASDPNQAYEMALAQILQAANSNTDFVLQETLWNLFSPYGTLTTL
jgi:uncharacterized repeat protein (TIGR03803 family)